EHGAADISAERLAGEEALGGASTPHPGHALSGPITQRALVDRPMPDLGGPRWLGRAGIGHGLQQPGVARLVPVPQWQVQNRGSRTGAGAHCALRHTGARATAFSASFGQWLGLLQSQLHRASAQLWPSAGVHYAALPRAERHGGTADPYPE